MRSPPSGMLDSLCARWQRRLRTALRQAAAQAILTLIVASTRLGLTNAQQSGSGSPQPLAPHHPPTIALVQPAEGGSIPQDRPIVMFGFAPGDSADPIDARSLSVSVDGEDRSALFQLARNEAWGPLAPSAEFQSLTPGAHAIAARICSIRGACGEVAASIEVTAPPKAVTSSGTSRKPRLVDLLLMAVKKLLSQ